MVHGYLSCSSSIRGQSTCGQVHGFTWTSTRVHVDKYMGTRGQVHGYLCHSSSVHGQGTHGQVSMYLSCWTSTQVLVPQLKCPWTSTHGQASLYWSCWTGTVMS